MKKNDSQKACEYCRFANEIKLTEDMLCTHRGVVGKDYSCRKFTYDPLKRIPKKLPEMPGLDKEITEAE